MLALETWRYAGTEISWASCNCPSSSASICHIYWYSEMLCGNRKEAVNSKVKTYLANVFPSPNSHVNLLSISQKSQASVLLFMLIRYTHFFRFGSHFSYATLQNAHKSREMQTRGHCVVNKQSGWEEVQAENATP